MPLPVVVAVLQAVSLARVVERLGAAEDLAAQRERMAGVDRGDLGVDAHAHPAEHVDDPLEAMEVDHGSAVEPEPGELGEGRREQLNPAGAAATELERRVDLLAAAVELGRCEL